MSLSIDTVKKHLSYFPEAKIRRKCAFATLFEVKTFLFPFRSLVEDDDAHMKVALGYGDMGISAHLQASKTGNTRFFTSNTHSSVVLQVRVQTHSDRVFSELSQILTMSDNNIHICLSIYLDVL